MRGQGTFEYILLLGGALLITTLALTLLTTNAPKVDTQKQCALAARAALECFTNGAFDATHTFSFQGQTVACDCANIGSPSGQAAAGTVTPTPSVSITPSGTPTPSASATPSVTPTDTPTPSPTITPSTTPTPEPTDTPTPTATTTPSSTPTPSATASATPSGSSVDFVIFDFDTSNGNNWRVLGVNKATHSIVSKIDHVSGWGPGTMNGWPIPYMVPAPKGHATITQVQGLADTNKAWEVDDQGKVVWALTDYIFKQGSNWKDQMSPRMASNIGGGHTIISSPNANNPSRLIEVDAAGTITQVTGMSDAYEPETVLGLGGGNYFVLDYHQHYGYDMNPRVMHMTAGGAATATLLTKNFGMPYPYQAFPLGANVFIFGMDNTGANYIIEIADYAGSNPTKVWQSGNLAPSIHFVPMDEDNILIADPYGQRVYQMDKLTGQTVWEYAATSWSCDATVAAAGPCRPYEIFPGSFNGFAG